MENATRPVRRGGRRRRMRAVVGTASFSGDTSIVIASCYWTRRSSETK